jgi:hypothetical protein
MRTFLPGVFIIAMPTNRAMDKSDVL